MLFLFLNLLMFRKTFLMITKHELTCKFVKTADPLNPRDKARTATTIPLSLMNGIESSNPPGIMCAIIVKSMYYKNLERILSTSLSISHRIYRRISELVLDLFYFAASNLQYNQKLCHK